VIAARRGSDVPHAPHGGRLDFGPNVRHDFSVCLNAFGPAPTVLEAIRGATVDEYPDPTSRRARAAASAAWSVPVESLILGAGSAELIDLVCRAFVAPGDVVGIDAPAFGEYERAARIYGATVVHEIDDGARVVFVCSPSNPLGQIRTRDELRDVADRCAERGAILVIDQAYDDFAEHPIGTPALIGHPAVLHLRSLTKGHALAGIRVAFGVGAPPIIEALEAVRVPWSASSVAQRAAIAALEPDVLKHVAGTTSVLRRESSRLRGSLSALGYETNDSTTHFFTIRVRNAVDARRELLARFQILVRDCSSFGLPDRIRVAARIPDANDDLLHALAEQSATLL
jgi:histidinol-phosphate/aromatic aminotransferase/cobyric acid decarboxylase-like protein